MKGDNASSVEDIDFSFLPSCSFFQADGMCCLSFSFISPAFIFDPFSLFFFLCEHFSLSFFTPHFPLCTPQSTHICLSCSPSDPGAVVETHSAVPYAVIGGVLALLVFTVICVLIVTIWCSVRQKGNALTFKRQVTQQFLSKAYETFQESAVFYHISTGMFSHLSTFQLHMLLKYYWIAVVSSLRKVRC